MLCPQCNNQIPDDSAFCPMCGNMNFTPHEAEQTAFEPGYTQPLVQPQDETGYTQPLVQPAPSQAYQNGYQQSETPQAYPTQAYQPQYVPVSPPLPQKKNNKSLIIIAALAAVAVIAIVFAILFGTGVLGGKDKKDDNSGGGYAAHEDVVKEESTKEHKEDETEAHSETIEFPTETETQSQYNTMSDGVNSSVGKIMVEFQEFKLNEEMGGRFNYVAADYSNPVGPVYYIHMTIEQDPLNGVNAVYCLYPKANNSYDIYIKYINAPEDYTAEEKEKFEGTVVKVDSLDANDLLDFVFIILKTKAYLKEEYPEFSSYYVGTESFTITGDAKKYEISDDEYIWIDADTGCLVKAEIENAHVLIKKITTGKSVSLPEVNMAAAIEV